MREQTFDSVMVSNVRKKQILKAGIGNQQQTVTGKESTYDLQKISGYGIVRSGAWHDAPACAGRQ